MAQTKRTTSKARTPKVVQAWIQLRTDDPAAVSAHAVAKRELAGGEQLRSLQRWRLVELSGSLPEREQIEERLHASTQFFNPHKEACRLRLCDEDPSPIGADAHAILVLDHDDERRPAAERWWRQETGKRVAVREGIVWVLEFEPGTDGAEATRTLDVVRDRRHGLFCNPHAQDSEVAHASAPLPWISSTSRTGAGA